MLSRWYFGESLTTGALFLELTVAALLVILLAARLTRLADRLADELNLGKAWIGMLLLATVTSLPEVVTGSTAVAIGTPDMAFAAIFGSCSLNLTLIVMINAVMGGGSVLRRTTSSHTLTSTFGIILLALALLGITVVDRYADQVALAQTCELVVCGSIAIAYVNFVRMTYRFDRATGAVEATALDDQPHTPRLGLKIAIIALVLVLAAWWLTRTGDVLAVHPIGVLGRPLGASFVGVLFLALATSLPEIVTCLAAVRIGQLDLALGNIFGSNMFNILVIPILKVVAMLCGDTLLMAGGNFHASTNILAGLLPVLITGIVVLGLTYPTKRQVRRLGIDSVFIALTYMAGIYLLFAGSG